MCYLFGSYFNNVQLKQTTTHIVCLLMTMELYLNSIQYLCRLFYNCYFFMDVDWMVELDNVCIRLFFDSLVVASVVHNRLSFMNDSSNDRIGFAAIFRFMVDNGCFNCRIRDILNHVHHCLLLLLLIRR